MDQPTTFPIAGSKYAIIDADLPLTKSHGLLASRAARRWIAIGSIGREIHNYNDISNI